MATDVALCFSPSHGDLYPVTPLVYVALRLDTGDALRERPVESLGGLGTLGVGMGVWWLAHGPATPRARTVGR